MTERQMGDRFGAFTCPKCGGISIQPRLKWEKIAGLEHILIWCSDCGYCEGWPTADAKREERE